MFVPLDRPAPVRCDNSRHLSPARCCHRRRATTGRNPAARGRRSIALPTSCVSRLRKNRAAQKAARRRGGEIWEDRGFVFTKETGGPRHVNSLVNRYEKLIVTASVPKIRFHDVRHTSATLLLAEGVHPKHN